VCVCVCVCVEYVGPIPDQSKDGGWSGDDYSLLYTPWACLRPPVKTCVPRHNEATCGALSDSDGAALEPTNLQKRMAIYAVGLLPCDLRQLYGTGMGV